MGVRQIHQKSNPVTPYRNISYDLSFNSSGSSLPISLTLNEGPLPGWVHRTRQQMAGPVGRCDSEMAQALAL
jgi:hypothetical protein